MICCACLHPNLKPWAYSLTDTRYPSKKKKYDYVMCEKCGSILQDKLRADLDTSDYYPKNYETHSINYNKNEQVSFLKRIFRRLCLNSFGYSSGIKIGFNRFLGQYVGWMPYSNKIVDIGCGADFLNKLKLLGVEAIGFDFDESAVETAKKYGLNVRNGGIKEAVKYIKDSNVSMYHVIEHLTDPINDIKYLYENLTTAN